MFYLHCDLCPFWIFWILSELFWSFWFPPPPPQIDGPTDYCPAAMNSVYGFCYLAALNSVYNRVSCISFGMFLFLVILMACPFCTSLSEFMNCLWNLSVCSLCIVISLGSLNSLNSLNSFYIVSEPSQVFWTFTTLGLGYGTVIRFVF